MTPYGAELVETVARAMAERHRAYIGSHATAARWTWDMMDNTSKAYWRDNARAALAATFAALHEPSASAIDAVALGVSGMVANLAQPVGMGLAPPEKATKAVAVIAIHEWLAQIQQEIGE